MADHNELGELGERMAQRFLLSNAYKILDVNWQYGHKEIDIVAFNNNTLHIIEVKTRKQDFVERPQDAVSLKKQQLIIEAANAYVIKNKLDYPVQFDIISVVTNPKFQKFEHIEDAFYPRVRRF